jgi:hypothetical protein
MKMVETYFGGEVVVRQQLAAAVKSAREKAKISNDVLDGYCGFGEPEFPTKSAEFEADPSRITGRAFGLASVVLDINADDVLKPTLRAGQKEAIIDEMRLSGAHVTAACGGGDVSRVPMDDQVPVYILLKAIDELG